jgi:hypothetical protein
MDALRNFGFYLSALPEVRNFLSSFGQIGGVVAPWSIIAALRLGERPRYG